MRWRSGTGDRGELSRCGGSIAPAELAQFGLVAGVTAAGVLSASRTTSAQQFDALRTQIDQLAADSGYNGVSLLNGGGLKVVFNQAATSFQTIAGSMTVKKRGCTLSRKGWASAAADLDRGRTGQSREA